VPLGDEDREAVAESVTLTSAGPEAFLVRAVIGTVDFDENPVPGRPEVTGTWRVEFRDPLPQKVWRIDLQRTQEAEVEREVGQMVARRLAGDEDLSGGQPHIYRDARDG
jgi:hypothetical protein